MRSPLISLFILFSSITHAQSSSLPWWAASMSQVESAPCKSTEVPSLSSLKNEISRMASSSTRGSETIHGVRLIDQPEILLKAFRDLTTRMARSGGTWGGINEPQVNIQREYAITASCQKVECALASIWGEEDSSKMLWIYLKHGFNTSELAFDDTDRFSSDEIDDVILTLEDLDPRLVPLAFQKNQRLVPISAQAPYTSTVADSTIILMNSWRSKNSLERQLTLFHELGHNISYRRLNQMQTANWNGLPACYMSLYGQASRGEDFAEAVVAYRYNANNFKNKCPQKYNFLKQNVFTREYLSSSSCR